MTSSNAVRKDAERYCKMISNRNYFVLEYFVLPCSLKLLKHMKLLNRKPSPHLCGTLFLIVFILLFQIVTHVTQRCNALCSSQILLAVFKNTL